jgi:DNA-binding winged helix-turn-helix (wHTH) protein
MLAMDNRGMIQGTQSPPMETLGSAQPDAVFHFGPFELSEGEGELRKNGVRVKLQEQPFLVLVEFAANAGRIVTREELQQKIVARRYIC